MLNKFSGGAAPAPKNKPPVSKKSTKRIGPFIRNMAPWGAGLLTGIGFGAGGAYGLDYVVGDSDDGGSSTFSAVDALAVIAGGVGGYKLSDKLLGDRIGTVGKVGIGVGTGLLSGIAAQQLRQALK